MKVGLRNTLILLEALENPHHKFSSVHIAGTNGKGSTAAMAASALLASGYRVGLYTSPHLVKFNERIRVDARPIPETEVIEYVKYLRRFIERVQATFFEATTALAFRYFADKKVDVALVETGLGGRLDSTNVLRPLLSVITSIAKDHTEILGPTIRSIAREKGGIIKHGTECLVGEVDETARKTLQSIGESRRAKVTFAGDRTSVLIRNLTSRKMKVSIQNRILGVGELDCSLVGGFQKSNIVLALTVLDRLRQMGFKQIHGSEVRKAFSDIRKYSGLRGRMEMVSNNPPIIIDVAHNPHAMRSVVETLRSMTVGRITVVFGAMKDKDVPGMVDALLPITKLAIAVAPKGERALNPSRIAELFHIRRSRCVVGSSVHRGIGMALEYAGKRMPILITGSHYVVGEFLEQD
jgi:dihydrofolate synthase/folylpolyglutamate synthase